MDRRNALRAAAGAGALVLLSLLWLNQQPSIQPDDVQIQAVLQPPGQAENPQPGFADKWTLEIALDKRTERPLYKNDATWFFQVTPFVDGMGISVWDFKQGVSSGSPTGSDDFAMGHDGRHIPLVTQALRTHGVAVTEHEVAGIVAFGFVGERFPAEVRYYLQGNEAALAGQRPLVVYSHYERRWGRDLSWTKAFPVQMNP